MLHARIDSVSLESDNKGALEITQSNLLLRAGLIRTCSNQELVQSSLNTSKDGDATSSHGNLFLHSATFVFFFPNT